MKVGSQTIVAVSFSTDGSRAGFRVRAVLNSFLYLNKNGRKKKLLRLALAL